MGMLLRRCVGVDKKPSKNINENTDKPTKPVIPKTKKKGNK